MRLLGALSSQILKISKNEDSTASLGNLLYCLTVLMGKRFLITPSLKLFFINLMPVASHAPSECHYKEPGSGVY